MQPEQKSHKKLYITLIIILVLALAGAVGCIVWDKTTQQTSPTEQAALDEKDRGAKKPNNTEADKVAAEPGLKEVCTKYEKVCFSYPGGWTVDIQEDVSVTRLRDGCMGGFCKLRFRHFL